MTDPLDLQESVESLDGLVQMAAPDHQDLLVQLVKVDLLDRLENEERTEIPVLKVKGVPLDLLVQLENPDRLVQVAQAGLEDLPDQVDHQEKVVYVDQSDHLDQLVREGNLVKEAALANLGNQESVVCQGLMVIMELMDDPDQLDLLAKEDHLENLDLEVQMDLREREAEMVIMVALDLPENQESKAH